MHGHSLATPPTFQAPLPRLDNLSFMDALTFGETPLSQAATPSTASPFFSVPQMANYTGLTELQAAVRSGLRDGASEEAILSLVQEEILAWNAAQPPNAEALAPALPISSEHPTDKAGSSARDMKDKGKASQRDAPKQGKHNARRDITSMGVAKRGASQGNTSERKKHKPNSCPHNAWKCEDRTSRAQWKSKQKFFKHYRDNHLKGLPRNKVDGKLNCTECGRGGFPVDGAALLEHLWFDEMLYKGEDEQRT
ncbi:unnamed protein product [Alternaria alternata]